MRYIFIAITFFVLSLTVMGQQLEEHSVNSILKGPNQIDSKVSQPAVELVLPKPDKEFSWSSQVRYFIHVNDEVDGDSKYNEIDPTEVFLEVNFIPGHTNSDGQSLYEEINRDRNLRGLMLLGRYSCFGCHADKSSMIGPSFSEIASLNTQDTASINKIADNIIHGSSGTWGESQMPANPQISKQEASDIVEFILSQGSQERSWVYPGLEGVIRTIDKPQGIDTGRYLLTASYTSSVQKRGKHTVILIIQ